MLNAQLCLKNNKVFFKYQFLSIHTDNVPTCMYVYELKFPPLNIMKSCMYNVYCTLYIVHEILGSCNKVESMYESIVDFTYTRKSNHIHLLSMLCALCTLYIVSKIRYRGLQGQKIAMCLFMFSFYFTMYSVHYLKEIGAQNPNA